MVAEVRDEGFTVLWENTNAPIIADIVLIHGLQGHPKKTWYFGTYEPSQKRPAGRYSWSLLKSSTDHSNDCYWPEDLLPKDFPGCRILTYGYDAYVSRFFTGAASQTSIIDHAKGLLNSLQNIREEATDRPIIFIAHSLGGILLKEALKQSWESRLDVKVVAKSTVSTIFMGTPHRGSELASTGLGLEKLAKIIRFDTSDALLRVLKIDSTILDTLVEEFARVLDSERFHVFTFRESRKIRIPLTYNEKVVSNASSRIGYAHEIVDYINANHREMCRFAGRFDQGYQKVKGAIKRSLQAHDLSAYTDSRGIHSGAFQALLNDLYTPEARLRLVQVEPAFKNTFEWIYSNECLGFQAWLESDAPLFWIRGKPASGKSTLMKMIYSNALTETSIQRPGCKSSFAAFFFHDRGSHVQKSLEGLLKEVLHQILKDIPELRVEAFCLYSAARNKELFSWELSNLMDLFRRIVLQTERDIVIFLCLDALDEYVGPHKDVIKLILEACSNGTSKRRTTMKVCFSSRPEQLFLDSFDAVPVISIHEHTADDIRKVVDQEFKANPRMSALMSQVSKRYTNGIERVRSRIISSAKGVFLWVRLILDELLSDFTAGHSLDDLYEKLETLPKDLHAFYTYLVSRKIPAKYARKSRVMFDLLLCSIRPLSLEQFMTAYQLAGLETLNDHPKDAEINLEETERLIRGISGGLIEIRSSLTHPARNRPSSGSASSMTITLVDTSSVIHKQKASIRNSPDISKVGTRIPTSEYPGKTHVDTELADSGIPLEQLEHELEQVKTPRRPDLSFYQVQFLHQTVKTFVRTNLEPELQKDHCGYVSLLKFYLYVICLYEHPHINRLISSQYGDEDFLQYLQLADSTTRASQFALLRQVPIPHLCTFLTKASTRRELPATNNLVKLAILAKAPRTLAHIINQRNSVKSYIDYMNTSASAFSDSFQYFTKCYLWTSSYGDPREIAEVLLQKNWGEDAFWNGLSDFMNAERGIGQSPNEISDLIVSTAEKALKLGVNPNYVLPSHDSHCHDTTVQITHLIKAVIMSKNPTPVIRLLLSNKVNLSVKDEKGATPLKHAIDAYIYAAINVLECRGMPESVQEYYARFDTAKLLLDNGAMLSNEGPVRCLLLSEQQAILDQLGYPTDERFEVLPEHALWQWSSLSKQGSLKHVSSCVLTLLVWGLSIWFLIA